MSINSINTKKFAFVGVSTTESSVNKYFDAWAKLLGQSWRLVHMDAALGDSVRLRQHLYELRDNPELIGALVTSHKAPVYELGSVLGLEEVEPAGSLCEAGFLDKVNGRLRMRVSDVDSQKPVMRRLVADPHVEGGDFLVLGAGGAGLAFAWNAAVESIGRPRSVTVIESDASRVSRAREIVGKWYVESPVMVDHISLSAALESFSQGDTQVTFVVNASGEGKDRISSPCNVEGFSDRPLTFWDFNYRGSLDLLRAFESLPNENLVTEDGLEYFYGGWSVVMSGVAGLRWNASVAESFGDAAKMIDATALPS